SHAFDGADGIQIVGQAQGFVVADLAFGRHPGRREVVLHHADPAVVRLFDVAGLALVDVREGDLLEFLFGRVQGGARERAVEGRLVGRVVAVAGQLQLQGGRDGGVATVVDVVPHVDVVAALVQGVGLYHLDAAALGFENDLQRISGKGGIGGNQPERRQMRGVALAGGGSNDTGLRHVDGLGGVVQQDHGLVFGARGGVLDQFRLDELCTLGVEGQVVDICLDLDFFRRAGGRLRAAARNRGIGGGSRSGGGGR